MRGKWALTLQLARNVLDTSIEQRIYFQVVVYVRKPKKASPMMVPMPKIDE